MIEHGWLSTKLTLLSIGTLRPDLLSYHYESTSGMLIIAGAHSQRKQKQLQRQCQNGKLKRLRRGIYVPAREFRVLPLWDRFDLHCIATAVSRPANFLVDKAAASVWGIPFGTVPKWAELSSETHSSKDRDSLLKMRNSTLLADEALHQLSQPFQAGRITSLAQSLIDPARWHPLSAAVQAIDYCLHHRLVTKADRERLLPHLTGKKGAKAAAQAILFAHPAAESPRESLI